MLFYLKHRINSTYILKNNKPRYVVVDFDEYDTIAAAMQMRKAKIDGVAEKLIVENMEALLELAK